jgi:hypothetical protein
MPSGNFQRNENRMLKKGLDQLLESLPEFAPQRGEYWPLIG